MGLDAVELVMDLAAAFELSEDKGVTDTEAATVGGLYEWVRAQVAPESASGVFAGELSERFLDVVEQSTRIPRSKLSPDAVFRDLGLN